MEQSLREYAGWAEEDPVEEMLRAGATAIANSVEELLSILDK